MVPASLGFKNLGLFKIIYLTLSIKNAFVFMIINFLQMGTGFEIISDVSEDNTPTWVLRQNLDELQNQNEDKNRILKLETLIAVRSEMES